MENQSLNIADRLAALALLQPDACAVAAPCGIDCATGRARYRRVTFAATQTRCDRLAHGLAGAGITRGMRVLVMVRPGAEFVPLIFALFKIGAVPVLIDPGMGWRNLVHAVRQVEPAAFIGIPQAHLLRWLAPKCFAGVKIRIVLGPGACGLFGKSLGALAASASAAPFPTAATAPDEMAAILFTTGSTGPAKGVIYTHRIFDAQVRLLKDVYGLGPGDVDLPCFPLFGLFSVALGATAVIPVMDFTRPARVNPKNIIEPVLHEGVTYSFGSPALWRTVGAHCAANGVKLPGLRQIFMAGAPVAAALHECLLKQVLSPGAETFTPYGATESLPVSSFTGSAVLAETAAKSRQGAGTCVGWPVPGITARILPISENPAAVFSETEEIAINSVGAGVPPACNRGATPILQEGIPVVAEVPDLPVGEIGEIVVTGAVVTPGYWGLPEATRKAKIRDAQGRLWHRMGDAGYRDAQGRLWFCGRLAHRVRTPQGTLFSVPCEAIFNQHPQVSRSALVGLAEGELRITNGIRNSPFAIPVQRPVMVIEPKPGCFPRSRAARERFVAELLELARANPLTAGITELLFHPSFPVDIRHNAKIRREELAVWAAKRPRWGRRQGDVG